MIQEIKKLFATFQAALLEMYLAEKLTDQEYEAISNLAERIENGDTKAQAILEAWRPGMQL